MDCYWGVTGGVLGGATAFDCITNWMCGDNILAICNPLREPSLKYNCLHSMFKKKHDINTFLFLVCRF